MNEALRELRRLANDLSEDETTLKVKCLLKVRFVYLCVCEDYRVVSLIESGSLTLLFHVYHGGQGGIHVLGER